MAVEVPWARCDGVLAAQVTRSGESEAVTARRQLEFGHAYPAGGARKKL